ELIHAARSIGARRMLVGELVGSAAQLTISATITDTRTGKSVQHFVIGPVDSLPAKIDALAATLLSMDAGEPRDRMAALTTTSLPALRSFLVGVDAARRSEHVDAMKGFLGALDADSTFALAALGAIEEQGWGAPMPPGGLKRAKDIAWRERARLSDLDKLELYGYIGDTYPTPQSDVAMCRFFKQLIQRAPDRASGWHNYADCLYHYGTLSTDTSWRSASRLGFEKSLALDSTFMPNVEHLIPLAATRRDTVELKRLIALIDNGDDNRHDIAENGRWWLKYAQHRPLSELLAIDSLKHIPVQWVLESTDDMELADTLAGIIAQRAIAKAPDHRRNKFMAAWDGLIRGQLEATHRAIVGDDPQHPDSTQFTNAVLMAMYSELPEEYAKDASQKLANRLAAAPRDSLVRGLRFPLCVVEQWRLWHGDASHTVATLEVMRSPDPDSVQLPNRRPSSLMCAQMLEAIRATVQKKPNALQLARGVDSMAAGFSRWSSHNNYMRMVASRLLELNGDVAGARIAVRRFSYVLSAHIFIEAQLLQDARLSAKLGDKPAAISAYRKYLGLHKNADAVGKVRVDQARRELVTLTGERS
ncbi:MAG TPA: hypothetical protein VM100_03460, partial [Longimicrobiales bacterium]|nr:hypothetical protein [Longimicrobiales bacterium]